MKKYVYSFSLFLLSCLCLASCSTEEELSDWHAAPGVYDIEMNVSALPGAAQDASGGQTRGIADNQSFDNRYDPDVIYLHKVVADGEQDQRVRFSLRDITCTDGRQCYGFNYRFVVYGLLLIFMMRFRSQGLLGGLSKKPYKLPKGVLRPGEQDQASLGKQVK